MASVAIPASVIRIAEVNQPEEVFSGSSFPQTTGQIRPADGETCQMPSKMAKH